MSMDDLQIFKATYMAECYELLADMEERLMNLDEQSADKEELNAIFRCAHSIKGGAGAFGFTHIMKFTHVLEALLDGMRDGKIPTSRAAIDILLKSQDVVHRMVAAAQDNQTLPDDFGADIANQLQILCDGGASPSVSFASPVTTSLPISQATIGQMGWQIYFKPHPQLLASGNEPLLLLRELAGLGQATIAAHLDRLPTLESIDPEQCYLAWDIVLETQAPLAAIKEVFEFVEDECELRIEPLKVPEAEDTAELPETMPDAQEKAPAITTASKASQLHKEEAGAVPVATSIRVDISKVDRLINMVGEVVITQAMIFAQTKHLPAKEWADLLQGIDELSQHTRELQESVMAIRMQPVKSIFSRMPRIVRDVSAQLGKDIRLEMHGENTEVDKTIIEQLSDPLTHLIRNALDHGIETPERRRAAGKDGQGVITLSAEHRGGRIVIEIADNGAGIHREKVLKKAVDKGLVAADATLSDEEIDHLIFLPGFSTADVVSNISGRGVGMDVVRRNIESLGGAVLVHSTPGEGSIFSISLPLTLAILDGMVVRVGAEPYIIPINHIIETLRPHPTHVQQTADGNTVIHVRGEFVPLLFLHRVFGIPQAIEVPHHGLVVLVENGKQRVGVMVDELIGQQQVVIKTLEENTDAVEGVSGATILGDGMVALILDITALCRMLDHSQNLSRSAA